MNLAFFHYPDRELVYNQETKKYDAINFGSHIVRRPNYYTVVIDAKKNIVSPIFSTTTEAKSWAKANNYRSRHGYTLDQSHPAGEKQMWY
jgi:hypothetical protein